MPHSGWRGGNATRVGIARLIVRDLRNTGCNSVLETSRRNTPGNLAGCFGLTASPPSRPLSCKIGFIILFLIPFVTGPMFLSLGEASKRIRSRIMYSKLGNNNSRDGGEAQPRGGKIKLGWEEGATPRKGCVGGGVRGICASRRGRIPYEVNARGDRSLAIIGQGYLTLSLSVLGPSRFSPPSPVFAWKVMSLFF